MLPAEKLWLHTVKWWMWSRSLQAALHHHWEVVQIAVKTRAVRWTGSWAQADTFQLNCLHCFLDCPKAICPSLHSFNCLLMLSTCLLSCPQSRTQLAQLPAHAPPCLEIKQLLLSWAWVTLHFTSWLKTNSCRRSDRPQDSLVEGKRAPRVKRLNCPIKPLCKLVGGNFC